MVHLVEVSFEFIYRPFKILAWITNDLPNLSYSSYKSAKRLNEAISFEVYNRLEMNGS